MSNPASELDRREFLQGGLAAVASAAIVEGAVAGAPNQGGVKRPHNIILIVSDQESFGLNRPKDYELQIGRAHV